MRLIMLILRDCLRLNSPAAQDYSMRIILCDRSCLFSCLILYDYSHSCSVNDHDHPMRIHSELCDHLQLN